MQLGMAFMKRDEKLAAKRYNERVKLTAGAINALGLALIISGMVFPVVRAGAPEALARPFTWIWVLAGMTLHVIAHVVLGLLKNEG